jgi:hypothetical protein
MGGLLKVEVNIRSTHGRDDQYMKNIKERVHL